jgi:7-cyano-7-deazaguanine synthase
MGREALLLSGGLDSTALAFWRRPAVAITVDYGQVCAEAEVRASKQVCGALDLAHEVVRADCSSLGSGDLSSGGALELAPAPEWWPFRNQLIVTLAAIRALEVGATELLIATVNDDGFHADGSKEFVDALSALLALQEGNLSLQAPAVQITSAELMLRSGVPASLLGWTHSCHTHNYACGRCRGCHKHATVLKKAGFLP